MSARAALLLLAFACWHAWRLLLLRIEDGAAAVLVLALLLALLAGLRRAGPVQIAPVQIIASLLLYAVAALTGLALLEIGTAVVALALVAHRLAGSALPRLPLAGLALLALPVLPTLDFLLAYPLRRVSALLAAGLLRLNGLGVGVEGVALSWHGRLLLFDGPCSGVRMLWAALLLASLLALAGRHPPGRYARALAAAVVLAIFGNALRAASLFYVENGFVPALGGPMAHEAIGASAFLLIGALAVALATQRPRPA